MKLSELEPGLIEVGYKKVATYIDPNEAVDKIHWYNNKEERKVVLVYEEIQTGTVLMFEPVKNAKDILNYHSAISLTKTSS